MYMYLILEFAAMHNVHLEKKTMLIVEYIWKMKRLEQTFFSEKPYFLIYIHNFYLFEFFSFLSDYSINRNNFW